MRLFPKVPQQIWCLEHAVLFQMSASDISRAGTLFREVWLAHDIGFYCEDEQGRIALYPDNHRRYFAVNGPFGRLIVESGFDVKQFAIRPALQDPEGVSVSPTLVLAAINYNYVYRKDLSIAAKSKKPPVLVFHWDYGSED